MRLDVLGSQRLSVFGRFSFLWKSVSIFTSSFNYPPTPAYIFNRVLHNKPLGSDGFGHRRRCGHVLVFFAFQSSVFLLSNQRRRAIGASAHVPARLVPLWRASFRGGREHNVLLDPQIALQPHDPMRRVRCGV